MKISILTPAFNSGPYLERAIESVLLQQDKDFEHIIVDGGSTDQTLDILGKYSHLRWISEPDAGQSDAMNKAFRLSSGDWIVYLNADDWFEPGVFAHIRELTSNHVDCDFIIGNLYLRHSDRPEVKLSIPAKDYRRCLEYYRYRFPMNPVSYFYRREIQHRVGEFPIELNYAMDYWFLLRGMSIAKILESDLVFGTFFATGENKTSLQGNAEDPWQVASRHVREFDQRSRLFFYSQWILHRYVRELPERIKQPFRRLVFMILFRKRMTYERYSRIGFRNAYNQLFR